MTRSRTVRASSCPRMVDLTAEDAGREAESPSWPSLRLTYISESR